MGSRVGMQRIPSKISGRTAKRPEIYRKREDRSIEEDRRGDRRGQKVNIEMEPWGNDKTS